MATPRVLVLRAPGINCDEETQFAWQTAGAVADRLHINGLIQNPKRLAAYQVLTIPGGFSYGDDIAGGKILGLQIENHLADALRAFLDSDGLLLGICNGLQVLLRMGLLPGAGCGAAVSITSNDSGRYEDRWVYVRAETADCPFLDAGRSYHLPVAHGEGKIVTAEDGAGAIQLRQAGRIALSYVRPDGGAPSYPENPNGSIENAAGLVDSTGRIFGLMPHPERCITQTQNPDEIRPIRVENGDVPVCDGLAMFRRAVGVLR